MNKTVLALYAFMLFTVSMCAQDPWEILNPTPTSQSGVDIQFMTPDHGFIITRFYTLLETKNGGKSWEIKKSFGGNDTWEDMAFQGSSGYIVGNNGYVQKTEDMGENWERIQMELTDRINTVNIINKDTVYMSGFSQMAQSVDGGNKWTLLPITDVGVNKIFFTNGRVGHAACRNGLILKTIDGGLNWYTTEQTEENVSAFISIYFVDEKTGFASKSNGDFYGTTDKGESWQYTHNMEVGIESIYFIDSETGYAGGEEGILLTTNDGGLSWESIGFLEGRFFDATIQGIHFNDKNRGFTVGQRGRITMTTDGGQSWTENGFTFDHIKQLDFPSSTTGYALTSNEISKTEDNGATWINLGSPLSENKTKSLQFIDEQIGYAIVGGNRISDPSLYVYKTADGGNSWSPTNQGNPLEAEIDINALYFINENVGYATGNTFARVFRIFKTTDGGDTWKVTGDKQIMKMKFINDSVGYGMSNHSIFYKTSTSGSAWEEILDTGSDITDFDVYDSETIYIGTSEGLMYKSENGGIEWNILSSAPKVFQEKVDFINSSIGSLVSGNVVYSTIDGGLSWSSSRVGDGIMDMAYTSEKIYVRGSYGELHARTYDVTSSYSSLEIVKGSLHVFPNPASRVIQMEIEDSQKITAYTMYDMTGRKVMQGKNLDTSKIEIILPESLHGLYIINAIVGENYAFSNRLVILK